MKIRIYVSFRCVSANTGTKLDAQTCTETTIVVRYECLENGTWRHVKRRVSKQELYRETRFLLASAAGCSGLEVSCQASASSSIVIGNGHWYSSDVIVTTIIWQASVKSCRAINDRD